MRDLSRDRRGLIGVVIAVIAVVIVIFVIIALVFLPVRSVGIDESRQADVPEDVEAVEFNLNTDVGQVNVEFVNGTDEVTMSVTGFQRSGILGASEPVNVSFQERVSGDTLVIDSTVRLGGGTGFFSSNEVNTTVRIPSDLRAALDISSSLGGVEVTTVEGVNLTSVDIETSTGGSRLLLVDNTTLSGPLRMSASLGGVDLRWTNVRATDGARVDLSASTGGVNYVITQTEPLGAVVPVTSNTSLGGTNMIMVIEGNNSAQVVSSANLGGVSVQESEGFVGDDGNLTSTNYPTGSRFEVTNRADTGGVNLRLTYRE